MPIPVVNGRYSVQLPQWSQLLWILGTVRKYHSVQAGRSQIHPAWPVPTLAVIYNFSARSAQHPAASPPPNKPTAETHGAQASIAEAGPNTQPRAGTNHGTSHMHRLFNAGFHSDPDETAEDENTGVPQGNEDSDLNDETMRTRSTDKANADEPSTQKPTECIARTEASTQSRKIRTSDVS